MSPFESVVESLTLDESTSKVEDSEYKKFQRVWVIYALQEKRFGQAFCEHFKLPTTTPLYYFKDEKISRRWIQDNYLKL